MSNTAKILQHVMASPTTDADDIRLDCYNCIHRRTVPGSCHSACAKPDPDMTGHKHGIQSGWFMYPFNFDPAWGTKDCANFEAKATP